MMSLQEKIEIISADIVRLYVKTALQEYVDTGEIWDVLHSTYELLNDHRGIAFEADPLIEKQRAIMDGQRALEFGGDVDGRERDIREAAQ